MIQSTNGIGQVLQEVMDFGEAAGPFVKPIISIAGVFVKKALAAKANTAQCRRLADRVDIIKPTLERAQTARCSEQFVRAAKDFERHIHKGIKLVDKFSEKGWVMRWITSGIDKSKFEEFSQRLSQCIQQIGFSLQVETAISLEVVVDRALDRRDQVADYQDLLSRQDYLIQLRHGEIQQIQQADLKAEERHHIIQLQMHSVKSLLEATLRREYSLISHIATEIKQQQAEMQGNIKELAADNQLKHSEVITQLQEISSEVHRLRLEREMTKSELDPKLLVPFHEINIQEILTRGSFGTIYIGKWCNRKVAVKMIEGDLTPEAHKGFIREVKIMSRLRNPNIVSFYGASVEPGIKCLVMERMFQQSLYQYLNKTKKNQAPLNLKIQRKILYDVARGLDYLHNRQVLHKDLKSTKVLIDKNLRAKITGFGLSHIQGFHSIADTSQATKSYMWQAPEVFMDNSYTEESDIYSFGLIAYTLFTGAEPYAGFTRKEVLQSILSNTHNLTIPNEVPAPYADLIRNCCHEDLNERPTLEKILQRLSTQKHQKNSQDIYEEAENLSKKGKYVEALSKYHQAAQQNHPKAHRKLAQIYKSNPDHKNLQKYYHHLTTAAELGDQFAQFNLGLMLWDGQDNILKDQQQALIWLKKADDQGLKQASDEYHKRKGSLPAQ